MKKHGIKRILAAAMTACMVVGAVPGMAFAGVASETTESIIQPDAKKYTIDGNETENENDAAIILQKKATSLGNDQYRIEMTVDAEKAKDQIQMNPTKVAFVLDASGSMAWCTNENHNHSRATGGKNCGKVSDSNLSRWDTAIKEIGEMSDELKAAGVECSYIYFHTESRLLRPDKKVAEEYSSIDPLKKITPDGGTCLSKGVEKGIDSLTKAGKDTNKILIIFSDGASDDGYMERPSQRKKLDDFKKVGKSYTINFSFNKSEDSINETAFNKLANEKNLNAKNGDELKDAFSSITKDIIGGIEDSLGKNVKLVEGTLRASSGTATCEGKTIKWTSTGAIKDTISLTYDVELEDNAKNTFGQEINLNGTANFQYSYVQKGKTENKQIAFPIPAVKREKTEINYTVTYNANGGKWAGTYQTKDGYQLNEDHSVLSNASLTAKDMVKNLAGTDAPSRKGYKFKGWSTSNAENAGVELLSDVNVSAAAQNRTVMLYAVWEEDGSAQSELVTYSVTKHYIDTDENDPVYNKQVDVGQTAEAGSLIENVIAADQKNQSYNDAEYLYDRATVTVNGVTTACTAESQFQTGKNTIDLYYYRDSWKEGSDDAKASEKGGDGTADIKQVLVKFGNKDGNGTVTDKGTATNDGTVQVYTLEEGQKSVKPSLNGVNVTPAKGYKFAKWTKDNLTSDITPDIDLSAKGGDEIDFWAWFISEEPEKPEAPKKPVATDLPSVIVTCVNENRTHEESAAYPITEHFTIGDVTEEDGTYVSEVTVESWYYAEKFNETSGVKHPITVDNATFKMRWDVQEGKWKAVATSITPIKVTCAGSETPETPELPSDEDVKNLVEKVVLVHTGSNAAHKDAEYDLIDGSYELTKLGTEKAAVTVKADPYVKDYNEENGTHTVQGSALAKLILKHTEDGWTIEEGETPVRFTVQCTGKTPEETEKPALPKYDELKNLFGEAITVTCTTDADHAAATFGLMAGSYGVTRDKEDDDAAVVTIRAAKYIEAFNDGKHTNAGNDAARVNLIYDEEDGTWYAADEKIVIDFEAKCEKKAPEKQYTEIKFVVVNGTFTENGQTEITKTFEVGHKLVITDIPASEGKNRNYSDQTWDKYPLGYTVGEEGCTFTITYKWKAGGSDSDSDDRDESSVSTRKYATDAAGKHGRWILEGGEFTEDNGRLPSNEYLKIGDTIYGFYTHGFAIDFDRPEYYTDAAIQAKGGYRDATGTWRLNGWWFCYDDGTFPHDEWVHLTWNGHSDWYYFDVDGWMEDGWLFQNNNWYYLHTQYDNTRGHMVTGWQNIDGKWYYFNTASDEGTLGAMLVNTTTPDGCKVDANGVWIQ